MQVIALFRPRKRKDWVERLRASGVTIRFVHDTERITEEYTLIIIDTTVGKWKEYIRLVQDTNLPILLLVDDPNQWSKEQCESLGVLGAISENDPSDLLFARFLYPIANSTSLVNRSEQGADEQFQVTASSAAETDVKPAEPVVTHEAGEPQQTQQEEKDQTVNVPLSQRKAVRLVGKHVTQDVGGTHQLDSLEERRAEQNPLPELPEEQEVSQLSASQVKILYPSDKEWEVRAEDSTQQETSHSPPIFSHPVEHAFPSAAAVYAAKGGVGKTTFLLQLAASLAKQHVRVCVLDLDLWHGTVASMLHIQPHKTIVDLVHRIEHPNAWRACLLQMKAGFSIVAAPLHPGRFQLHAEPLQKLLYVLKENTDILLIDTSSHFDPITKMILEQMEQVWLFSTEEPASLHNLAKMKPLLGSLHPSPELYVVGNRLTKSIPKEQWKEQLPWPILLELPEDSTLGLEIRKGQFIVDSPCSPYRIRVNQLVDQWRGVESNRQYPRPNLLRRLLFRA